MEVTLQKHKPSRDRSTSLPPEILQLIADDLQLSDATSFSLCNRRLSIVFGSKYCTQLHASHNNASQRSRFLLALARDIPSWFFCHWCSHLHPRDRVGPPGPAHQPKKPLFCLKNNFQPNLWPYLSVHEALSLYNFHFHHLQLAMERHYFGARHGIAADSLSFAEVVESGENGVRGPLTTLLSVEARVCAEPSRLCLRIQHWVILHTRRRDSVLRKLECVTICNHLRSHNGTAFPALIESSLDACSAGAGRASNPEICQCRPCDLDFQLEFQDLGGIGMALVVTKWLDLGRGLGLRLTFTEGGSRGSDLRGALLERVQGPITLCQAGELRSAFEREEGLSQGALYLQNRAHLTNQRYKETMGHWNVRTWVLQAGQPVHSYSPLPVLPLWASALGDRVLQFFGKSSAKPEDSS